MADYNYFQAMGGQIGADAQILTPPRYMARRSETTQFANYAPLRVKQSLPEHVQQAQPQMNAGHSIVEQNYDFNAKAEGSAIGQVSQKPLPKQTPISISVLDNELKSALDTTPTIHAMATRFTDTVQVNAGFNAPSENLAIPASERRTFQSTAPATLTSKLETAQPFALNTAQTHAFSDPQLPAEEPTRRLTSISQQFLDILDVKAPDSGEERIFAKQLESRIEALLPDARQKQTETLEKPWTIVNAAEIPNLTAGFKEYTKPDNGHKIIQIGVVEISVVASPQATQQAQPLATLSKLSLSRGVSCGYGIKQG